MMKTYKLLIPMLLAFLAFSCKKDSATTGATSYSVRMTDAPAAYDAINIDLQAVRVTGNDGAEVLLNTHAGIYNLLNFSNGHDTLIATGLLNVSRVEQIRFILGPNNTIVVDGITYPLSTPSAEQSGLKLQVHQNLQPGVAYSVLIDFDASKSIIQTGGGQYKLKPVLRTIETAISGSIRGKVTPAGTLAMVTATSVPLGETYSSPVNGSGDFLVMGLPAGTYSVTVTPAFPFAPFTVNNVQVTTGVSTDIGIVPF